MARTVDRTKPASSLKQLNAELHKMGMPKDVELVRHSTGYYWFSGGDTHMWHSSSVYAYNQNFLTIEQWYRRYSEMHEEYLEKVRRNEAADRTDEVLNALRSLMEKAQDVVESWESSGPGEGASGYSMEMLRRELDTLKQNFGL